MNKLLQRFAILFILVLLGCTYGPSDVTGSGTGSSSTYDSSGTSSNDGLSLTGSSLPYSIRPNTKTTARIRFTSNPGISSSDISVTVKNNYGGAVVSSDMDADVEWFSETESGTIVLTLFGKATYKSYIFTVTVYNGYDQEEITFQVNTSDDTIVKNNSVLLGSVIPAVCTASTYGSNTITMRYTASPAISSDSIEITVFDNFGDTVYSYFELPVNVEYFQPDTAGTIKVEVTGEGYADYYMVQVKALNGDAVDAVRFKVITGSEINNPGFSKIKTNQYLYDINGTKPGAYDLINGIQRKYNESDMSKDLEDIADGELGITGILGSANGTRFEFSILNYYDATAQEVIDEASSEAYYSQTDELVPDDVIIARLGNNRGFALIQIVEVAKSSVEIGNGYIRFNYKLVKN